MPPRDAASRAVELLALCAICQLLLRSAAGGDAQMLRLQALLSAEMLEMSDRY